ncbi:MAG: hypothetical protein IPK19_24450 [Chloroflexi bacterium]|nr:hypothetical protein [Chloroflexota bacterium]
MRVKLMVSMFIVLLIAAGVSAQSDDQPEDPRLLSYVVCDWGLITVEEPAEQPAVFIDIDSPADYSAVGSAFTVSGTGAGLFEGNVIVGKSLGVWRRRAPYGTDGAASRSGRCGRVMVAGHRSR